MNKSLEELYLGNLRINTDEYFCAEYHHTKRTVEKAEADLLNSLEGSEKEILLQVVNGYQKMIGIAQLEKFKAGFGLGNTLAFEGLKYFNCLIQEDLFGV